MERNPSVWLRPFLLFLLASFALSCNRSVNQAQTPTPTPAPSATPPSTPTPTSTPEATPTPAATLTPGPTATPEATSTPTPASTPGAGSAPQPTSPSPPAMATMPDEASMSKADRVRVQEALRRLLGEHAWYWPAPKATTIVRSRDVSGCLQRRSLSGVLAS